MYGGYPGSLREEKAVTLESPFQTLASAVTPFLLTRWACTSI